jgi:uncharacterized membrane protein YkoI
MKSRILLLGLSTAAIAFGGTYCAAASAPVLNRPSVRALDKGDKQEDKDEHKDKQEEKVTVDQLPAAVTDAVKKAVPDGTITEAEKEVEKGQTVYEMDVKKGDTKYEVKTTEDGKVLKSKVDNDKDKD